MNYLDRSKWGAKAPTWNPGPVTNSQGMFIHYNGPAVSPAVLAGDYESVKRFILGIQAFHQSRQGWPDLAYSWIVDSVGRIWEGRGWGVAGAHTLNHNWSSHAIFLPLGGDQKPTPEQIRSCQTVIAEHDRRYGKGFVKGHRDAPNQTSCPGEPTMALLRAGAFNATTQPPPAVPAPPGVNIKMNKPVMMQEPSGTVWMYYEGTPFRIHVQTPADVNTYKYFGVEYKVVDAKTADFFRRNSQQVKCG